MEKLLYLLNEYEEYVKENDGFYLYNWTLEKGELLCENEKEGTKLDYTESYTILISYSYGFINWLIEKDKINLKLIKDFFDIGYLSSRGIYEDYVRKEVIAKELIMLLSISFTPIGDLQIILK